MEIKGEDIGEGGEGGEGGGGEWTYKKRRRKKHVLVLLKKAEIH